ncbi:hypothetical protein K2173_005559 [Erythroxylum novogranatense]|uniref:F-box/LRR-repeat protein n=1 Tax=Erythroxylum novogranatense TaxID=1862640 RepID=A0AAV8SL95_9ROSI|nr:hypothetical protein K2173_005559 [Erythroxylum novogranatense]
MDKPSSSSLKNQKSKEMAVTGFDSINDDLVHNILKRLPALSFASAACVSKSWNRICNHILSRPKFASAMSLNPSSLVCAQEVVDRVLSEPIRPHFAIANVVGVFVLRADAILEFLADKLGSRTPIVLSSANGIMGRNVVNEEFKEVLPGDSCSDGDAEENLDGSCGMVLTVGLVPGLKVEAIPLIGITKVPGMGVVDNFVMAIRNFSTSVSGSTSPLGIIMFGDEESELKCIVEKLDYALSKETIVVGDEKAQFVCRSGSEAINIGRRRKVSSGAVALVFARDREKPYGVGEIQFHAALSDGVSAIGPRYKAASVRVSTSDYTTWLTARREGRQDILDGQRILNDINDDLGNRIECPALFIGVTRRRKCIIGSEKSRFMTSLAFHAVIGGDEEYLFADGVGIKTGDYFQFYHSDRNTASSSCTNVSEKLKNLKLGLTNRSFFQTEDVANSVQEREFIGGFIFSCCGRGESFFGRPNVDSSPFLENFPGIPTAGVFCGGEIGRGLSLNANESSEESITCLHVYSSVYLLMSYTPMASLEH